MKKIKLLLTGLSLVLAGIFAFGQNIQVTGTVTDGSTGEPVAYASIQLKGTVVGTATDLDGNFTISAPANGTLIFTFIGYTTQEVAINQRTKINVVMTPDAVHLEDVLVVAYGTVRREAKTGSVSTLENSVIA